MIVQLQNQPNHTTTTEQFWQYSKSQLRCGQAQKTNLVKNEFVEEHYQTISLQPIGALPPQTQSSAPVTIESTSSTATSSGSRHVLTRWTVDTYIVPRTQTQPGDQSSAIDQGQDDIVSADRWTIGQHSHRPIAWHQQYCDNAIALLLGSEVSGPVVSH